MKKLGLIAGSGELPSALVEYCKNSKIELFCVLIKPFANAMNYSDVSFIEVDIGCVGEAISFFRKNDVGDLVFAGGVRKPAFSFLKVDLGGLSLIKNILKNKLLGDNSVLEIVADFFRKHDFQILEVDSILNNLKLEAGFNGKIKCSRSYLEDINIGKNLLEELSDFDVGQTVAVQQKIVLGIECVEGTASLIERVNGLKYSSGNKPVLVKIKKTKQTRKMDLPAIGPDTIEQLHRSGFAGIAIDYKNCLVIAKDRVIEKATNFGIFIYGLEA
ncbi:MAG: UDP-2,3-diacylglucosamine diphosphatase LpxI [Rickettsiales bacterium]|jgi:DUF1009 family protein|nr:UDP-2,3-diacylglucosamine diphosphatase LpxI [Rickettsiales bacterium]